MTTMLTIHLRRFSILALNKPSTKKEKKNKKPKEAIPKVLLTKK
jgi:hypothetical protein